jgi:hypothetical protein
MTEAKPSLRRYKAQQISAELYNDNRAMLKIETDKGSVLVTMERGILEKLLRQAEPIRLSSLNTPEIQVV